MDVPHDKETGYFGENDPAASTVVSLETLPRRNMQRESMLASAPILAKILRGRDSASSSLHSSQLSSGWKEEHTHESVSSNAIFQLILSACRSKSRSGVGLLLIATRFSKVQRIIDQSSHGLLAREYFAILSGHLKPLSFSMSEEYRDPLGARVVDCFRGGERISCIVSAERLQVLSFLKNKFHDQVFEKSEKSKLRLVEYLHSLSISERNADLDTTESR